MPTNIDASEKNDECHWTAIMTGADVTVEWLVESNRGCAGVLVA